MNPTRLKIKCILAIIISFYAELEIFADLIVENSEQLTFLVDGTEAASKKVTTIRANINSIQTFESAGQSPVTIINKTSWISRGPQFKFEAELTQLYDGQPPEEGIAGDKKVPIGKRFSHGAYTEGIFVDYRPLTKIAIIRAWDKDLASSLQDREAHEPLFFGQSVMGLPLKDIVSGGSWRIRPEDTGLPAKRFIKWAGTKQHKGEDVHVIEMTVEWTKSDGTQKQRFYEIYVDPEKGFTIPYVSVASKGNGNPRRVFEIIEVESVEYGESIWGPIRSTHTLFFNTPEGEGKSVTTNTIENIEFNTSVSDNELKVVMADGTRLNDQIVGLYYIYGIGDAEEILKSIEDAHSQAGINTPLPIKIGNPILQKQEKDQPVNVIQQEKTDDFLKKSSSNDIDSDTNVLARISMGIGILVAFFVSVYLLRLMQKRSKNES